MSSRKWPLLQYTAAIAHHPSPPVGEAPPGMGIVLPSASLSLRRCDGKCDSWGDRMLGRKPLIARLPQLGERDRPQLWIVRPDERLQW